MRARPRRARAPATHAAKSGRDPLLAAICHDLRAPLAAVTMGTNFVLQTTGTDESNGRQRRILEAMLRSCAQMERLVRNFADLSEIEGGSPPLRLDFHDAGEMLEFVADAASESAGGRGISIQVHKPAQPVTLRCDRDRLLRALDHVVENATKVAPQGSSIELGVDESDGEVGFHVTDHGPGIDAEVRKNLFDREWHAKRANRVGAGFGLAIARGFATAHGGRVAVDSQPGNTVLSLTVPTGGPDAARSRSSRGAPSRRARTRAGTAVRAPRRRSR